jgi:hypothetical protein
MAVTLGVGAASLTGSEELPATVAEGLLDEGALEAGDDDERSRLLRLLARHPSARVRERLAAWPSERAQPLTPELEAVLAELVRDPNPSVHWAAIGSLGALLKGVPGVDQLALVSEWTLASHRLQRLAVACALAGSQSPIADMALELLASDVDPLVGVAARHAERHRQAERQL